MQGWIWNCVVLCIFSPCCKFSVCNKELHHFIFTITMHYFNQQNLFWTCFAREVNMENDLYSLSNMCLRLILREPALALNSVQCLWRWLGQYPKQSPRNSNLVLSLSNPLTLKGHKWAADWVRECKQEQMLERMSDVIEQSCYARFKQRKSMGFWSTAGRQRFCAHISTVLLY